MNLQYREEEQQESIVEQIRRPIHQLVGWFTTEQRTETQTAPQMVNVLEQNMLLETINEAIPLCSTKILTQADVGKINEVLSHRSTFYLTDYRQVGTAFENFISGHGYIKTGGFDFEFQRTNSFRLSFGGFTLEMSDAALFMLLAFIFGVIVFAAIFPGASVLAVQAGAVSYSATCSIQ